ncbi:MAG: hypothetical protein DRI34_11295 [Deltaproteobacteria bacterium]|nr:MAG: hypothetical protein DRI34_11295 [Deltaproteobacteria bacterium]
METIDRYLRPQVERDLSRKMVLVGGPRQVVKTTLALHIAGGEYAGNRGDRHKGKRLGISLLARPSDCPVDNYLMLKVNIIWPASCC